MNSRERSTAFRAEEAASTLVSCPHARPERKTAAIMSWSIAPSLEPTEIGPSHLLTGESDIVTWMGPENDADHENLIQPGPRVVFEGQAWGTGGRMKTTMAWLALGVFALPAAAD